MIIKDYFKQKTIAYFLIISISFLVGLVMDLNVPSLPMISKYFNAPMSIIETSISLYVLGFGLGQIILGILSDRYGRRNILIFCSTLFILSCMLCVVSYSTMMFNTLRFIQGVSVAGLSISGRSIIVDLFTGVELRKASNYLTLSWSLGPIVGPFIGSNLGHHFGWQANFYLFSIYGCLIFFISYSLFTETNVNVSKLNIGLICRNFFTILKNRTFVFTSVISSLYFSAIILFNTVGPSLIETRLGYSVIQCGYIATVFGLAYLIGLIINRYLITKYLGEHILKVGTFCALGCSCIMLLLSFVVRPNLEIIVIPLFLMFLFSGLIVPTAMAIALSMFPKKAGLAVGTFGTINGLILFVVSLMGTTLTINTTSPLSSAYVCIFFIVLILATSLNIDHVKVVK